MPEDARMTFRVSPEEKRLLLESIAQADRGEVVDGDDLIAELDESMAVLSESHESAKTRA